MNWVRKEVQFEQLAQQATLLDYLHEVEHMAARVARLEQAIEEAVQLAPQQMREVIEALQALRGIAKVSAVTIVAELGELSRFGEARQLMAYSGTVAREHSSGESGPTRADCPRQLPTDHDYAASTREYLSDQPS
jgi:transposase